MSCWNGSVKFLKLIGSSQENIESLLSSLNCRCEAIQQFRNILTILYDKIDRLREQRDSYKHIIKQKCNCNLTKSQPQKLKQNFAGFSQKQTVQKIIYFGQIYKQIQTIIYANSQKVTDCNILKHHLNIPLKQSVTVSQQRQEQILLPSDQSLEISSGSCIQKRTTKKQKTLRQQNSNIFKHEFQQKNQIDKQKNTKFALNNVQTCCKQSKKRSHQSIEGENTNQASQIQLQMFLKHYQQNSNLSSGVKSRKFSKFVT